MIKSFGCKVKIKILSGAEWHDLLFCPYVISITDTVVCQGRPLERAFILPFTCRRIFDRVFYIFATDAFVSPPEAQLLT